MPVILLMRHGEPDYSGPRKWDAPGWGVDLAPLTDRGEKQVMGQIDKIRNFNPDVVITSPATRAIHSALVLKQELKMAFKVEFDLHEWVPDRSFQWKTLGDVQKLQSDYEESHGQWPLGEERPWEQLNSVRARAIGVFRRYASYDRVLAICHGEVIKAVTGVKRVDLAGLIPFDLRAYESSA